MTSNFFLSELLIERPHLLYIAPAIVGLSFLLLFSDPRAPFFGFRKGYPSPKLDTCFFLLSISFFIPLITIGSVDLYFQASKRPNLFYIVAAIMGLSFLLLSFWTFCRNHTSKIASYFLLLSISFFIPLITMGSADLYFYFSKEKWYQQTNKISMEYDCANITGHKELEEFDIEDDTIVLASNLFGSKPEVISGNLRLVRDGNELVLSSKDGKSGYLEFIHHQKLFPNYSVQLFVGAQVRVEGGASTQLGVFLLDRSAPVERKIPIDAPDDRRWNLIGAPLWDIDFEQLNEKEDFAEQIRIRIYVEGRGSVRYRNPKLVAAHIYNPYPTDAPREEWQTIYQHSGYGNLYEAINRKKSHDSFRILAMGGSTTFGFGTGVHGTYPVALRAFLNGFFRNAKDKPVEVINAGKMGNVLLAMLYQWDRTDERKRFIRNSYNKDLFFPFECINYTLKDLKPDMVLLAPMFNDLFFMQHRANLINKKGPQSDKEYYFSETINKLLRNSFLVQNFALGHYFYNFYYMIFVGTVTDDFPVGVIPNREEGLVLYKSLLTEVIQKIKKDGVEVVLAQFPADPRSEDEYSFILSNDYKIISQVAKEQGIEFVSIYKNSKNYRSIEGYWYDYIHPRATGYTDYALKLARRIGPILKSQLK